MLIEVLKCLESFLVDLLLIIKILNFYDICFFGGDVVGDYRKRLLGFKDMYVFWSRGDIYVIFLSRIKLCWIFWAFVGLVSFWGY